jgi:hypothetical protein
MDILVDSDNTYRFLDISFGKRIKYELIKIKLVSVKVEDIVEIIYDIICEKFEWKMQKKKLKLG